MQFDTALNFIWLALGVFAFCGTLRARRASQAPRGPAWLHLCGVALIIAALFPYVSATDDVVRIHHLNVQPNEDAPRIHHDGSHKSSSDKPSEALIRLYEIMDAPLVGVIQTVSFSFAFIALVVAPALQPVSRYLTFRNGRSPPFAIA